ncbi:MAG: hypothetical protein ACXWDM_01465 [Nocardioides sp.]
MRWRSWRPTAALGLLAGLVTVLGGCTTGEVPPAPEPAAEPERTTLESYDTAGVDVIRGPFCDRVSPTGIEHALGNVPAESESWDDGDRERLPDGTRDRVHEYGCRWTAADATQASAWVFAPPVTAAQARALTRDVSRNAFGATCRPAPEPGDFGAPGATATCSLDSGGTLVERAGLFGDAWLTCSVLAAGNPVDLAERVSEWCVHVVEAARS